MSYAPASGQGSESGLSVGGVEIPMMSYAPASGQGSESGLSVGGVEIPMVSGPGGSGNFTVKDPFGGTSHDWIIDDSGMPARRWEF